MSVALKLTLGSRRELIPYVDITTINQNGDEAIAIIIISSNRYPSSMEEKESKADTHHLQKLPVL